MTTFVFPHESFKFEFMPFGLMNAPSTSERIMDFILREISFVHVSMDDVVFF